MRVVIILPGAWEGLHTFDDPACWCQPTVEWHDGVPVIIHNNPRGDVDTDWRVYDAESETIQVAA